MDQMTDSEEARLRNALRLIGDEAARSEPAEAVTSGTSEPPWWRRHRALLAACAIGIVATIGVIDATIPGDTDQEASQGLTGAERVACAKQIFTGTIQSVKGTSTSTEVFLTVRVDNWIKPVQRTQATVRFRTFSARSDALPRFRQGQTVFVITQDDSSIPADVFRGRDGVAERKDLERYLAEAEHTKCPRFWRHPNQSNVPDDS